MLEVINSMEYEPIEDLDIKETKSTYLLSETETEETEDESSEEEEESSTDSESDSE